jgi:hypothetical protein
VSRTGRILVLLIAVATVVLEVVAYRAVRNEVDGQAVLLNVFILFCALLTVLIVWLADRLMQGRQRRSRITTQG